MTAFKDILASLPTIDHLEALELSNSDGDSERLPNQPGKAGSLAVYNALMEEFGEINVQAAEKGLELFAEHTEDAKQNPGKHPNIDRLFNIVANNLSYQGKAIKKS